MSIIQANRYTDSYTKRPQPKGVGKFLLSPSPRELKAIRKGKNGAVCHERDLADIQRKAVAYAVNIRAKSWTMYPFIGDYQCRMIVEFYNWPEIGIYNFDHPFGNNLKKWYWWYNIPTPTWWTDPERAVGVSKAGDMIDPQA